MHGHLPQEKKEIRHFMNGDWENLPEGLLDAIAQRLPLTDCLAFHDVCTSWRRVVAKLSGFHARRFPWLVQCREDCTDFIITCFSVLENKLWELELPEAPFKYIVGSFQDWLILKKVTFSSTEFFLLNPFSRAIVVLPKVSDNLFYELVLSTVPTDANCVCMLISPYCNGVILYWVPGTERDTEVARTFEVFTLDIEQMAWVQMESLGDRILFTCRSGCSCFSSKELMGDGLNAIVGSICFTQYIDAPCRSNIEWSTGRLGGPSSFDDLSILRLDVKSTFNHSSVWLTAPIWWYLKNN
uniref:F-box domain-containing protein n=1 Tax=Nelumbo nucifera TaxID=4432 RepID=A0A822YMH0_NELNU|nr:TPA_asm: hypothetical protein HUJ06_011066 [Nelumbo nucifera]